MSLLVVGSVALDTVRTPFGMVEDALGGSAVFFAAAASTHTPAYVVGVIGDDFPRDKLAFLEERGVDLSGLVEEVGESFRWAGEYSYDLNSRETLETRLGVFADFKPVIPPAARQCPIVFLGNIHPQLQIDVLNQMDEPRLVAADTMNFWIEGERSALLDLLERVDLLMINDEEARQLAGVPNLLKAARWIQDRGPDHLVVKKGEHGSILFGKNDLFFLPGFPLEDVFDPTGAGDSFAGGFLGYLGSRDHWDEDTFRRAMVYGSVAGSFAVERFSIDRFRTLSREDVAERVRDFKRITTFEVELEHV